MLVAQRVCEEIVGRYEGYLAQSLGDGLIIYWGYPQAHEDDARRAVQAGLDIVHAIQRVDYWPIADVPSVHVRVGIHTGPVIVDTRGEQGVPEPIALGPTPQVAIHLLSVAEPNTVMVAASTARLVEGYFVCRLLGTQTFRGQSEPAEIYQLLSESGARYRLEATTSAGLTPFIGREEESNLLLKRWEEVQEGRGQVVLLSGEAGIGKSRLLQELREQLREQSICVETRCSPYHQQSAFYPVIDYIQRSLQFGRDETSEAKRQKLERVMARAHLEDGVSVFANLLSLPLPTDAYPTLTPQRQREKLLQVIVSWFLSLARHNPVLTVWEDLHWADPSTLELLQLLLEQLPTVPILAVLTFRPEFTHPWTPRSHVTSLMLGRLGVRNAEEMVEQVIKGKTLPHEVKEQIVHRADGIPLFVEELTKAVLESGLMKEREGAYHLLGPLPPLAIPTTLHDSLLARLDRLASVRDVAQVAAVLGREFAPEVLHAVVGGDEGALHLALEKLVAAEVLYRRGVAPRMRYVFKHALIQDAAYQSLLIGKRQQYHQLIARTLETRFPEAKEAQLEVIARHYTEAGDAAFAIPAWQRAGQNAIAQSAFVEAVEHLQKGLTVLTTLPQSSARYQQELHLYATLGPVLMALKGYAAPDVEKTYAHALALCRRVGQTPRLFQVLSGLEIYYFTRGELQTARQLGDQCLSLAQQEGNPARLLQTQVVLANILFYQGEFVLVEEYLRKSMATYNATSPQGVGRTLQDPGVNSLSYLSWTLWCRGYPEQAKQKGREALTLAEQLGWPLSQSMAIIFACGLGKLRREEQTALHYAEQAVVLATEQGFPLWTAYGKIVRGWALGQHGNYDEGLAQIRHGLAKIREMGANLVQSWFLLMLAETCAKVGQLNEGLSLISEALEITQKKGEVAFVAELYRVRGELMLAGARSLSLENRSSPQAPSLKPLVSEEAVREVERCFRQAIAIARQQQAKSWELRATLSLCRMRQQQFQDGAPHNSHPLFQARLDESHRMLRDVYTWFTEGFETPDLQEAKALLDELGH
ncbi:MAG: hypothetical protein FJ147_19770 [Deltaproteobacteria bacterium]|nr:hypothetical protein [Deltaproteobacteria bacterium]